MSTKTAGGARTQSAVPTAISAVSLYWSVLIWLDQLKMTTETGYKAELTPPFHLSTLPCLSEKARHIY